MKRHGGESKKSSYKDAKCINNCKYVLTHQLGDVWGA